MKRRLLSMLMVFIMIVTLIPLNQVFAAFGETGDPIVEGSAAIDILINAGTNSEVLAGALQDKLYEKLKELLQQEGIDVNVRINTPSVELDTNDLSDWYVYDHYDPYHQGDTGTVAPTAAVSKINSSTDYNPANIWKDTFDSDGTVSNLRPYFTNKATNNFVSYTLAKWVDLVNIVTKPIAGQTGDFPYNYGEVGSNSQRGSRVTMLGAFDQHIYSRNGIIDFVGYYTYNYNDFLFFPCASKEEKQVTFDIDSSGVNVHSLSSAGFLINTDIYYKESDVNKTTPYISGYVLCYEYDGGSSSNYVEDPVPDRISLYPIKEDTKAVDFHNNITGSAKSDTLVGKFCGAAIATTQLKDPLGIGTPAGTGSSKNASGSYVNQSLVKTARLCGDIEWDSKMNIRLTITPEILLVEQKPQSSYNWITVIDVDGGVPVGTSTTSAANPIYYSGTKLNSPYNGFGPIVGYTAVGHTCQRASQFTYSNIRMAYINQTDKIFQLLSGANYIQNADLYFIDLTDDGANRRLVEDGNNAAAYMQAKKIRYITNNPNDELLDNDGKGTTTGPLGENGLWMDSDDYRENNMSPIDIDALAEAIAKYILAQYGGAEPDYGDDLLPLSDPVALLSLVRDVNNVTTSFVDIVKRDLVGENGLKIFSYDIESKPSDGADIIQYDYEIIFPGGKTIIVSRTDPNEPLLIITNDKDEWPKGEYTVILKVTDEKNIGSVEIPDIVNKESQPVIVKFHIVEDIIPPLVETVTITDGKLTFTASDIGGYGVVGYELVCTPIGDGFSYGGVSYATNDGIQTFQIAVPGITAGSQTDLQTIEDVILPAGEYEIKLVVYDMAGNKTEVALPSIDYIGEKLIGLNPGTSGSGWTAADGTVNIADGWMGQNVVYTTTNSISDKDDKAIPGINTTVISIAVLSQWCL